MSRWIQRVTSCFCWAAGYKGARPPVSVYPIAYTYQSSKAVTWRMAPISSSSGRRPQCITDDDECALNFAFALCMYLYMLPTGCGSCCCSLLLLASLLWTAVTVVFSSAELNPTRTRRCDVMMITLVLGVFMLGYDGGVYWTEYRPLDYLLTKDIPADMPWLYLDLLLVSILFIHTLRVSLEVRSWIFLDLHQVSELFRNRTTRSLSRGLESKVRPNQDILIVTRFASSYH